MRVTQLALSQRPPHHSMPLLRWWLASGASRVQVECKERLSAPVPSKACSESPAPAPSAPPGLLRVRLRRPRFLQQIVGRVEGLHHVLLLMDMLHPVRVAVAKLRLGDREMSHATWCVAAEGDAERQRDTAVTVEFAEADARSDACACVTVRTQ
eukprot:955317-Rhodomonas_salina.1